MKIPIPVIAVVADALQNRYSHSEIDNLMEQVGIPGDSPGGNRLDKIKGWLRQANAEGVSDPLRLLGRTLEEYMEVDPLWAWGTIPDHIVEGRERISKKLAEYGLAYHKGGYVVRAGAAIVSRGLEEVIRQRDYSGLEAEFQRIYNNIEADPAAAVTSTCALLESLFKIYVADEGISLPSDQSIKPLWNVVRKHLKLDPSSLEDQDLQKVLSGLGSIVDGIGALRTHKSTAHGHGRTVYRIRPRHAKLTAHAAFTLATFIFETWDERSQANGMAESVGTVRQP